VKTFWIIHLI